MILYHNSRMDKPETIERLGAIIASVEAHGNRTAEQIAADTGILPRMVTLYVAYLRSIGQLGIFKRPSCTRREAAVFNRGPITGPLPTTAAPESVHVTGATVRRVGANDWPRGQEHVRRTGLMAYLYPFAPE